MGIDWKSKNWREMDFADRVDVLTTPDIDKFGEFISAVKSIERRKNIGDAELAAQAVDLFNQIEPDGLSPDIRRKYGEIQRSLYRD